MNRKALAYEFLLRLIIAILFVSAAIYIGKSLFRLTDSGLDSFNKFVFTADNLKDGQFKELGVDFDKGTAIIGFSEDAEKFESSSIFDKFDKAILKKPQNSECKSGACICLCRKSSYENLNTRAPELVCESITCNKLGSGLDIIDIYETENELLKIQVTWKGGFVYGRDIKATINGLNDYRPRTRVLRIENYQNIIAVCPAEKKECLSDEDKKALDQRIIEKLEKDTNIKLQKAFKDFINSLNGCKENIDKCGTLNFINGYNVYYIPTTEQEKDNGVYLLKRVSEPDVQRDLIKIDNEELKKLQITLYENENKELDKGYIFKDNKVVITSKDDKIVVS